ncbi:hypothetical protein BAUCODRAFT_134986 [Baudoinia panamericana UAMH 10762]|uniref:Uncharacterized protein n=1 Tax=Baudoinia panamericana (strain UAMH 10762) TaxID=717646 RepID=M2MJB6_BAUPA|nr:uncharacterized protein BAUCODRAFT_134986 [Baudoinia panamericana UAMH 10762]EMC91373.1 hypothetical protein BAUCODRAFT_134986 [Baudoinia panamericana UAMH 10762]
MSNFEQNPSDLHEDYFTEQEAHYFGRTAVGMRDTLRPPPRVDSRSTDPAPPSKDKRYVPGAVVAAQAAAAKLSTRTQEGPYPAIQQAALKLGAERPYPAIQHTSDTTDASPAGAQASTYKPIISRRPVGAPKQEFKPLDMSDSAYAPKPATAADHGKQIRTIYTNSEGKFDPATIRSESASRFTPPPSPLTSQTPDISRPRPSSRGGSFMSFGRSDRADTDSSNGRSSNTRRGIISDSFKNLGRRLSNSFQHKAAILNAGPDDRKVYVQEKERQVNPQPRASAQTGRDTVDFLNKLSLAEVEPEKQNGMSNALSFGDKAALKASELLDPIKRRERSGTMDSDMSFADCAPPDAIEKCSRCSQPPTGYLRKDGVCDGCHVYDRFLLSPCSVVLGFPRQSLVHAHRDPLETDLRSNAVPLIAQSEEYSPPYIHVAGTHRLRKLRNTIYEDPGNPWFEVEYGSHDGPTFTVPSKSNQVQSLGSIDKNGTGSGQPVPNSETAAAESKLPNGRPFDDADESPVVPPTPRRPVSEPKTIHARIPQWPIPSLKPQSHRRSVSVAVVPNTSVAEQTEESQYVSPRASWRRDSIPASHLPEIKKMEAKQEARDTRFYGFYDDILNDYNRRRESRL